MPQNDPLDGAIFHGGANQQWRLERADSSTVWPTWKLINVTSATVVDLANGSANSGNPIIGQVNQANNKNQLWYLISADPLGRVVKIQNIGTGTYVDLFDGNATNGAKITGNAGSVQDKNAHQLCFKIMTMVLENVHREDEKGFGRKMGLDGCYVLPNVCLSGNNVTRYDS
ncbi:hypothetical protein GGR58DRAFT_501925 [Xylaria digitata]|nr:hypothetical protein GGR58DRAFT_501925 [Xylaria digitata]